MRREYYVAFYRTKLLAAVSLHSIPIYGYCGIMSRNFRVELRHNVIIIIISYTGYRVAQYSGNNFANVGERNSNS